MHPLSISSRRLFVQKRRAWSGDMRALQGRVVYPEPFVREFFRG